MNCDAKMRMRQLRSARLGEQSCSTRKKVEKRRQLVQPASRWVCSHRKRGDASDSTRLEIQCLVTGGFVGALSSTQIVVHWNASVGRAWRSDTIVI